MDLNTISAINASKLVRFQSEIDKQAEAEIERLTAKVRQQSGESEKLRAKYEAHKEQAKIRSERNAAETRIKKEISRCESEIERTALSHRKKLIDGFFEELREELCVFAASDKYNAYLHNALQKAEAELGKDFVVLVRKIDVDKLKNITNNEVRIDNTITIGGIYAMNEKKGLFVDFSLDNAVKEEKKAFVSKKELRL